MNTRKAFTLTELLVVIAIIGMLASLITGAAMMAMNRGKEARVTMELRQIQMAIEKYKEKVGEYPPDLYETDSVLRHVRKRWPRFTLHSSASPVVTQLDSFRLVVNNVYRSPNRLNLLVNSGFAGLNNSTTFMGPPNPNNPISASNPNGSQYISAVPLWLGGFPNSDGKLDGFSADPVAPFGRIFTGPSNTDTEVCINDGRRAISGTEEVRLGTQEKETPMEMTIGKNVSFARQDSSKTYDVAYPCFVSDIGSGQKVPYVYFRGKADGGVFAYTYSTGNSPIVHAAKFYDFPSVFGNSSALEVATPYARSGDPFGGTYVAPVWYEPEKFQLIHPGMDGVFGLSSSQSGNVNVTASDALSPFNFRSLNVNAAKNDTGVKDYDNLTNFGEGKLEALFP